jgi:PAS domain S-box-containing protein
MRTASSNEPRQEPAAVGMPAHSLLQRQLKRHFGDGFQLPEEWRPFFDAVSDAYREFDDDRETLERSLELSSQELLRANAEMRAVFGAIPDMLFRLDRDGMILDFKAGFTSDLLLQRGELIGKHIQSIPIKTVGDEFQPALARALSEKTIVNLEYALPLQGQEGFYEARLVPLPDDQVVVIIRNITERRKSEDALSKAEAKYRSIFENSTEGIFQTTPDGKFITANPAMARILGFSSPEELMRERTDIALQGYAEPRGREEFKRLVEERGLLTGHEYQVRRRDGSTVWVSETAQAIRGPDGKVLYYEGMFEDITERKRTERLRAGQSHVLEMIATGAPLTETLLSLTRLIEAQSDKMLCSVLLLDADGKRLRNGASPSVPEPYVRAIDGLSIGSEVGSAGSAAFRKELVICGDIQQDPSWELGRDLAAQYGLRASWASPILSHQGKVLGTFAMYYQEPRRPNAAELRLIESATQIAGIAIARKQAEQELRQTVSVLQSTIESTADGILLVDLDGRILLYNKRFLSLWQIPQPVLESGDDNVVLAHVLGQLKEPELFLRKVRELYASPETESLDVLHFKDGRVLERYSCPQRLDGVPIGRVWSFRDVTERHRAEDELFRSQQMLRTVLDTIPQRVFWKDLDSRYVGCNKPLAQDCGYKDPSELIGKTDYETKSAATADIYRADDRNVMEGNQPKVNYEEPQIKADGTQGWLRTSKVPLHDKDGKVIGVLGTYEDITEHKRLEEQFRQSQKMEAFGQLAAGVAHDFNNILTVILGNLSLLQTGRLEGNDAVSALTQALNAADRAANLTRQLLTFGRRQPMRLMDLDLNEIVATMTKMLQRLIGEHIALEAHYTPGTAAVHVDRGMMEQVLMNLAVNSRDAMPRGGRLILETAVSTITEEQAQLKPESRKAGDYIRLSISDTGLGIAPEHLPHIFEPFFTTKEVGKGTGLGLATVFGIVEQHHGWIEVESQMNKGTTFHIYLPRLKRTAAAFSEGAIAGRVRGGHEFILLVEDETPVRELMRTLLERQGYRVQTAVSGVDALDLWERHKGAFDLLVTDMVMPEGLSGRELAERLRMDRPALKVMYCSGYTDDVLGIDSPLRTEQNFLEKPFEVKKFLQRVRSCLDGA